MAAQAGQWVSATIVAESEERSCTFNFKIQGYSRLKGLFKNGDWMTSAPFSFGGYNWVLRYYPNRCYPRKETYIRVILDSADVKDVKAKALFSVLDKDGLRVEQKSGFIQEKIFPRDSGGFGLFTNQAGLEQSGHIIDDCLSIKCDLTLMKDICKEEITGNRFVVVPPSDLHLHLGNLLDSMDGADVTFHVGEEKFLAHRFVLAARSSSP